MKLATLRDGSRDGRLVVVSRDLTRSAAAGTIAPTLQSALDRWADVAPLLEVLARDVELGSVPLERFHEREAMSPLPRAYQWVDGSAYVNHVELVRKARGAEMPASFWTDPLMYQGGSDAFLGPREPIRVADEAWDIDCEAEVAVIVDDVPMGAVATAREAIRLVMLVNDVSLRGLVPAELAKGFGFLHAKPSSAFSPVAVTPDELGTAWDGGRVHLPLLVSINGDGVRQGQCRHRHDLRFPAPRRPCREDPAARRRHHRRIGNGVEQGSGRRSRPAGRGGRPGVFLHCRVAHGRDDPARRAEDALPSFRRQRADRNEGRGRAFDLRRHRAERRASSRAEPAGIRGWRRSAHRNAGSDGPFYG